MSENWRNTFRAARRSAGLSMESVAREAELSYETVRGYENGRRTPTRDSLLKVLGVLRVSAAHANALLEGAGFARETALFGPDDALEPAFRIDELQRVVERRPWPAMATNDAVQVVAANRAIQALWGFDFAKEKRRRTARQMHMLVLGGEFGIIDRVANWPVTFRAATELNKGSRAGRRPSIQTEEMMEAIEAFAGGDSAKLKKLSRIWTNAKPMPPKMQADFPIVWRDPELGEMRFRSVMSVASERDLLHFRDWHPVDAESWDVLEQVKERWTRSRTRVRRPKA